MNSKELTPVEWFIEQLEEKGSASENVSIRRLEISIDVSEYLDLKRKAKEMEKEQMIDFARHCLDKAKNLDILTSFMNVEQYYNETFKQQGK
jgi:hypothetical protein